MSESPPEEQEQIAPLKAEPIDHVLDKLAQLNTDDMTAEEKRHSLRNFMADAWSNASELEDWLIERTNTDHPEVD